MPDRIQLYLENLLKMRKDEDAEFAYEKFRQILDSAGEHNLSLREIGRILIENNLSFPGWRDTVREYMEREEGPSGDPPEVAAARKAAQRQKNIRLARQRDRRSHQMAVARKLRREQKAESGGRGFE